MPIYEYECGKCGNLFELIQKISDPPPKKCPDCGSKRVRKMLTTSAFVFKGTGFYATDYQGKGNGNGNGNGKGKSNGNGNGSSSKPKANSESAKESSSSSSAGSSSSSSSCKSCTSKDCSSC
jgi:putative FmdB family regulatory protein